MEQAKKKLLQNFYEIKKKYNEIYLVRNEQELKIYNEDGRAFEPDFLLFCKDRSGDEINFQIFIEPKGDGYIANDKWKEEFLKKIFILFLLLILLQKKIKFY